LGKASLIVAAYTFYIGESVRRTDGARPAAGTPLEQKKELKTGPNL
jgi:hypothetical protein